MPQFFINRPVFAWVIALFIMLAGLIAIPRLPIEQYPAVAPPSVTITAVYPGASPQTLNDSVISLIEREISSVDNVLYFNSQSDTSGYATITVTFRPGTDIRLAQVDVQNQIKIAEPRLPQTVRQNGLSVEAASSSFLMLVALNSPSARYDEADLSDYFARNITDELRRVPGVGKVQLFGAEKAMRIWVDPNRMYNYRISMNDIITAINQQNTQIAPGRTGDAPVVSGQTLSYPLTVQGQLKTPEAFRDITLRASADGGRVRLKDVARVELGLQSYGFGIRENGQPATAAAIQLQPGANAVSTADAVIARMNTLKLSMPDGMDYSTPFNTAPYIKASIEKVIHTFIEAMVLVFLVMYLFLQNVRYTFIPAIVAPIALLGTFTMMLMAGFSVNVLTMFGMVLAIGIIVDDAIVVVENVERLMHEKGLAPREATQEAMREITPAIVGITLVLTAVFIPMGLASGSVGVIYRQFTLSMAVSILFSAFLALTLTPALCATLLKPVDKNARKHRFAQAFNHQFARLTGGYASLLGRMLRKSGRMMALYLALCAAMLLGFQLLPSSFLPDEDQGYFMTSIQLPSEATAERTASVIAQMETITAARPAVDRNTSVLGFGFSGSGPNTALVFTMMKEDQAGSSTAAEAANVMTQLGAIPDATVYSLMPPAISDLGTSSGLTLWLEDRAGQGDEKLKAAAAQLIDAAGKNPQLGLTYLNGLPDGKSIHLNIDRAKAQALGVSFDDINQTLSAATGSFYVNDFVNQGRVQQVIVQADAPYRMNLEDVLSLYVRSSSGSMVPLSVLAQAEWTLTPLQQMRFQGYPAVQISSQPAPGVTSGAAMIEMEKLAAQLPAGYAIEWTGESLQDREAAAQMLTLLGLSVVVVFLVLAALYESWSVPVSVMLAVPLGIIGAVVAVGLAGMSNDIFFRVGMITIIGLSAKNAILIVEFALQQRAQGMDLLQATLTAARLRLRPIIMTSLAFTLGVVPLMLATGASENTQHAIGTGVFGGMISGTLLAIIFVPVLFVVVSRLTRRRKEG